MSISQSQGASKDDKTIAEKVNELTHIHHEVSDAKEGKVEDLSQVEVSHKYITEQINRMNNNKLLESAGTHSNF